MKVGANLDLSKVLRSLGDGMKLVPHIDRCIGQGDFEWHASFAPKQGDDAWHPSGDCTPSLSELYLKATDQSADPPIPASLRKIFMAGHFWHAYLQWVVLERLGFCAPEHIEHGAEYRWGDGPYRWARGSADISHCDIPGTGTYLIDFKTVNPRQYAAGIPDSTLAKWECQGNIYLDWHKLDAAIFVAIDKSNGDMREYEFQRNQPLIDSLYAKWALVGECIAAGVAPPEDEPWPLPLQGPRT